MDAARQVLRFSIPGTLLVLLTIAFIAVDRLFQGDSLHGFADAIDANVAALATLFASIPLGFLAYQFYYLSFQPFVGLNAEWVKRWPDISRRWPRVDRGARVLSVFTIEERGAISALVGFEAANQAQERDDPPSPANSSPADAGGSIAAEEDGRDLGRLDAELTGTVPAESLLEFFGVQRLSDPFLEYNGVDPNHPYGDTQAFRRAVDAYEERWYENWDVLRVLIAQMSHLEGGELVLAEYATLSDFYHALGASRTACTMAFSLSTLVLLVCLIDGHASFWNAVPGFVSSAIAASGLWLAFNQTRRQTWKSAEMTLKYGLRFVLNRHPGFLWSAWEAS